MSGCWYAVGGLRGRGAPVPSWTGAEAPAWTGSTPSDIVDGLLTGAPAGTIDRKGNRREAPRDYAIEVATRLQAEALELALHDGWWSYEGASSEEIELLHHVRGFPVKPDLTWSGQFGLYLVRPLGRVPWAIPGGNFVSIIDPTTDTRLLASLIEVGVIKAGRLD